jgi:RHS repeat-associated protein
MRGRLLEIRDFNSNSVTIGWNQSIGVITQVLDSARGVYRFNHSPQSLLTNISFAAWSVNFAYDSSNRLSSKMLTNTSALYTNVNTAWQLSYNSTVGLIERILDPRGNTNIFVQYDQYGRKTNEFDALGRATQTRYGVPGKRQITHTDPGMNSWVETYDRKGHILAQQDPLTNITSYTYDTNGNRTTITEPLGYTTRFGYDSRANVIARTNELGEVTRWVFHPFFNKAVQEINPLNWTNYFAYDDHGSITNNFDDLGSLVRYTYSANGLVLTSTDGNGNVTRFSYDTNGFRISGTDPATNTTAFGYNEVGWKLAETNALGHITLLSLDLNGNGVRAVDPLQRVFLKTFDPNGNLLSASDARGQFTSYSYDIANQRTQMVDRAGSRWGYTYTTRGKPQAVTDPLANSVVNTYDAANHLISVTDPLGNSITNIYDANGRLTALIDKLGQRWSKAYDHLNRVTAESDPLGDTRQTTYDPVGRIFQTITPKGYPTSHEYDGRGRLTKWRDAEGFEWHYDYDGAANITNITDALSGHYVMSYGSRNERTLEQNQDGFQWGYSYDPLLRPSRQTDPNGTVRNLNYDAVGRLSSVSFSTLRTNLFYYDVNDNPTNLTRIKGGAQTTFRFDYDPLDRATNQIDSVTFQQVQYAYDPLGRMTNLTYPGSKPLRRDYDALGRLTNQVDWAGHQMSFFYDKANRLVRRTYPNGIAQTNAFDSAGQITNLTYSSLNPQLTTNALNIALTYAYDRSGNMSGSAEKGTINWPMPSLTDETARYTPSGRLVNRQIQSSISNQLSAINYQYDASGNMTNASGTGQSWAFAYDEDNRVLSVNWDAGITAKSISSRYDSLGRRVSRNMDGSTTSYVLDLSGNMERILCDLNPDATITYYVHCPDLCYKIDASGALTCLHADGQANIIALSDGATNTVSQYAYTSYGRSLGSTNLPSTITSQPYTFVGSYGVMEELPGLYFMRARYYSADAAVFLSTDQIKSIGPGWKPAAYAYANANPLQYLDPAGLLSQEQAAKMVHYEQETLYYQQKAIWWNALADSLQGVYDALQTTESLLTGDVVGVGTGLTKQLSTLARVMGKEDLSYALSTSADVVELGNAAYNIGKLANNYDKLTSHYTEIGGNWSRIANYSPSGPVGSMYGDVLQPVISSGFRGIGELGVVSLGGEVSRPDASKADAARQSTTLSGRAAGAGSYAQNLNSIQVAPPALSTRTAGITTAQAVSGGGSSGSGNNTFSKVANSVVSGVQKVSNSITQAVQSAVQAATTAINRAVSFISSFFGGGSKSGGHK